MKKIIFSYFAFSIFTLISLISSAEIRKGSQAAFQTSTIIANKTGVPYLEFDFATTMIIPTQYNRTKWQIVYSFNNKQLDGTRRIVMGNGGSARRYLDINKHSSSDTYMCFPNAWIDDPIQVKLRHYYVLEILAGIDDLHTQIYLDGICLATDFYITVRSYIAIGSYGQNTGQSNFAGRIYEIISFDINGNIIQHFVPYVDENNRACLKCEITNQLIYAEPITQDPIYGKELI